MLIFNIAYSISKRIAYYAILFSCRALREDDPKEKSELSTNDTCALKEDELKAKYEFSAAGICRILSESKLKAQLELSAAGNMQINISKNKGG